MHLGLSKLVKTCFTNSFSLETLSHPRGTLKKERKLLSMKTNILRRSNSILAAIQKDYILPGLHIEFSKNESSSQLNWFFTKDGIRRMLEGKNYRQIYIVFP